MLKLQSLLGRRQKKVPTTVTLAGEVLDGVKLIVPAKQRSKFVEAALRRELWRRLRQARNARDLAILDQRAERLNSETDDLLEIQADPFE